MRRLIVNADDFGITPGVNRAVAELSQAGGVSSATLMACSARFAEAVAAAKAQSELGVGCHVVLVDGFPASPPDTVPSLIDVRSGNGVPEFRRKLGLFVRDLSMGRIATAEMEREARAQIERLQRTGLRVTHVDTHKHTHLFPAVLDAVTRAAKACGVPAIRNPFEPGWSVASTPNAGLVRRLQVRVLGRMKRNFLRVTRERGLRTTDGCVGVLATGTLDARALPALLERMPEGTWELVCHPAYMDMELEETRTRLKESRVVELEALRGLAARLPAGTELIHFGQL